MLRFGVIEMVTGVTKVFYFYSYPGKLVIYVTRLAVGDRSPGAGCITRFLDRKYWHDTSRITRQEQVVYSTLLNHSVEVKKW